MTEGLQVSGSGFLDFGSSQSEGQEIQKLMQTINWAETPLGPVSGWSQSLRTTIGICLNSRFPILIWWGPDLIMLYNDAYRPILGATKHPRALGQAGRACWPEIWHIIGPMLNGVITNGQATWSEDQLLLLDRNGYIEECYFTFSYSPIHDENGICGAFTAVTETTDRVVSERRMRILADLSTSLNSAESEHQIFSLAAQTLSQIPQDLPFAALYLLDPAGGTRLVAQTGLAEQAPATMPRLEQGQERNGSAGLGGFPKRLPVGSFTPDDSLYRALFLSADEPGIQPISWIEMLPLGSPEAPLGFLIAGTSPYRPEDVEYLSFLSLVSGQIASALSRVRAFAEERKRAEALAELDRAKTEFFSNVSHEFRTPITLMLAPVQEALQDSRNSLAPPDRERLEIVYRNGQRLLKLVSTLLDFSRIEAGRIKASFQPVDLATLTADLASVFRSTIEQAGLQLEVDCAPLPEKIYIDPEMWEKILLNLISNAFKFTFEGQIGVRLDWKGDHVELRVSDTGTGISPEEIPLIFDRFHRVSGARSRSVEGSGIGLSLVQELVRMHGGSVTVTSVVDQGSVFTVTLPVGSAHLPPEQILREPAPVQVQVQNGAVPFVEEAKRWLPESHPARELAAGSSDYATIDGEALFPSDKAQPSTARILLVDDNADMREYLRRLLSSRWEIETAGDGLSALQAARENRPDLLLADVMMPGIDGFELLRRLREDLGMHDLPIILLSARAGEEARTEGLVRGADDYIVKPFSARELLARVESCLELARMRGELRRKITGILESMTDAFWAVDESWRVLYTNQAGARLAGMQQAAQNGTDARPYLQQLFPAHHWAQLVQAMQERSTTLFEQYQETENVWLEIRAYPYESGLAIYAADVTVRMKNTEIVHKMELQRRLLENRERERQEIARDIHDGPIQTLVSAIFNTQFAKESLEDALAKIELEQIGLSLKSAVRELREVINELRPPALIRFGLAKAIRVYIVDFEEKHPELQIHLELDEDGAALSEPVNLALYRVFQEGMNNIFRHAGASQAWVRFQMGVEAVIFEIEDNGRGFVESEHASLTRRGHYGLAGMKERVETIHGTFEVISTPGRGAKIRITVPIT